MEKRLIEVCDIQYGFPFDSDLFNENEGIPLIRIRDVKRGYSETYTTEKYDEEYIVNEGDILIGMDGEFNISKWGKTPAVLNQRVCRVFPHDDVEPDYIFYSLPQKLKQIEERTSFATVKHLSAKEINKIIIDIPDISEQRAIVKKVSIIEDVLRKREEQLEQLDLLIKARFVEMFGDNKFSIVSVEEICSNIVDCPHTTPKYEGILTNPAIRTSEIKKGYISWDTMKYVSDEEYIERTARLIPRSGDIVYGREGSFGNAAILPNGYKFCLGQRVMILRPDHNVCTSEYLLYAIISDDVYMQAKAKNNASTVAHVNVKDIKQFVIPLPPIELQNAFGDFVRQVDKSKLAVQKSLDETRLLFDSLMQKYFG